MISHKSIKCLGNWNFDVFRYKNSLTFICHQHQDLTIAKDNNDKIIIKDNNGDSKKNHLFK
jgi:hypothetical protein